MTIKSQITPAIELAMVSMINPLNLATSFKKIANEFAITLKRSANPEMYIVGLYYNYWKSGRSINPKNKGKINIFNIVKSNGETLPNNTKNIPTTISKEFKSMEQILEDNLPHIQHHATEVLKRTPKDNLMKLVESASKETLIEVILEIATPADLYEIATA